MLKLTKKIPHGEADYHITLAYELRQKARFKTQLDEGGEAGLFLSHGDILQHGDLLMSEDGKIVCVRAAIEPLSEVQCQNPLQLAKLCYHLGNRHVPLQIGENFVRYQPDHVLDHLVQQLQLTVHSLQASFEPESGAYQQQHAH